MFLFCLQLPLVFLKFWFLEGPRGLFLYFVSLNRAFLQLFSLPLLLRTYVKPLKNEYREGLVGFSIAMGIVVKTFFICIDIVLLKILMVMELIIFVIFIALPFITVLVLFKYL